MKEPPSVDLGQGLMLAKSNGQLQIVLTSGISPKGTRGKIYNPAPKIKPTPKVTSDEKSDQNERKDAQKQAVQRQPKAVPNARSKKSTNEGEETVTLTKKQLDALVGTINEVCELAAEEMDTMRRLKDSEGNVAPESDHASKGGRKKSPVIDHAVLSSKPTPEKKQRPPPPAHSKPTESTSHGAVNNNTAAPNRRKGGENIMDLLNKGKNKPAERKPARTNEKSTVAKPKMEEKPIDKRLERVNSTVSKAVSPIIVYEQVRPTRGNQKREREMRSKKDNKRDRSPMKRVSPTAPLNPKQSQPVKNSLADETSSELNITQISNSSRDLPVNESVQVSERKADESKVEMSPKSDSSKENRKEQKESVKLDPPMSLLEKKRQQWEAQKRENSTLRKELIVPELSKKQPIISHSPPPAPPEVERKRLNRNVPKSETDEGKDKSRLGRMTSSPQREQLMSPQVLSPRHVINQPSAMLDHFQIVSENDLAVTKKYEQQKWLKELEKQKEEQRLKKMIEDEMRKGFIDITPRRASAILAEVYLETEQDRQDNDKSLSPSNYPSLTSTHAQTYHRMQQEAKTKKFIQQRIAAHFPQDSQFLVVNKMGMNNAQVKKQSPRFEQSVPSNKKMMDMDETDGHQPLDNFKSSMDGKAVNNSNRQSVAFNPKIDTSGGGAPLETGQTAYNSSQTHLVFHQAFEDPVPVSDRPRNEFGRFKALIDPAEAERQRKDRERQQEYVKEVQQQIEAKRVAKEEEKRRREQEDLEDEQRIRRELALANNGNPSDYNRTRPAQNNDQEEDQQPQQLNQAVLDSKKHKQSMDSEPPNYYNHVNHTQNHATHRQREPPSQRDPPNVVNRRVPNTAGPQSAFGSGGGNVVHSPVDSSAYHLDPHHYIGRGGDESQMGMLTGTNVVHRQDSDVVVEYVPQHEIMAQANPNTSGLQGQQPNVAESAMTSSRYVDQDKQSAIPGIKQQNNRKTSNNRVANEQDLKRPENIRQKRKETLNKHNNNRNPSNQATGDTSTIGPAVSSRRQPPSSNRQETTTNRKAARSPPVPALQKKTLDKPAIPSRNKRAAPAPTTSSAHSNSNHNVNEAVGGGAIGMYQNTGSHVPETGRTQPTIVSSRYVDPNITSPPPVPNGDFIPFRRTSAHMDPAINSSRAHKEPYSQYEPGHNYQHPGARPLYQGGPAPPQRRAPPSEFSAGLDDPDAIRRDTASAYERQDAILKQLSTLRQGLMEKQREYNTQTPNQYET